MALYDTPVPSAARANYTRGADPPPRVACAEDTSADHAVVPTAIA
jgi:hypothetical protein